MGAIVRVPVFVKGDWPANETFGAPHPPTDCPNSCTVAGERFWGFAMGVMAWEKMKEQMDFQALEASGAVWMFLSAMHWQNRLLCWHGNHPWVVCCLLA